MEIFTNYDPFWTGFLWHDAKAIYIQQGLIVETFPKTERGYRDALAACEPCKVLHPATGDFDERSRAVARNVIRNNLRLKK
jgi:hypothetical protein